jgi:hypothetical protein
MDGRPFATTKLLGCENQLSMNTNETDRGELAPEPFDAPVTSTDAMNNHRSRFMIGDAELFFNTTILVVQAAGVAALVLDVDSTMLKRKRPWI